jgi:hypothetical protein
MRWLVCDMFLLAEGVSGGLMDTPKRPWPLSAVFCNAKILAGSYMSSFGCLLLYFGVSRHSGGCLELSPADYCEVLGEL